MDCLKIRRVSDLTGGEILASAVMTANFQVLLFEGTVLSAEYIEKLKELGIAEVYVKDEHLVRVEEVVILKTDIEKKFKEKVKSVLERHTYTNSQELVELSKTADHIISNILEEDEVVEKIFDIRERSSDIYEHSLSICTFAVLVALKMNIEKSAVHDLGVACLLHDLGLRYLTFDYNDQDIETLSNMKIVEYKKHPIYAYSALQNETWISNVSKNMILYHHECMDGSGYPFKIKELSLETKIISVCDSFDEMICGVGCSRTKVYEAVEYLRTFKNMKYDSRVVDVFLSFTAVYPVGSQVITNEGDIGFVLRQNKEFPDRPVIQIIQDRNGILVNKDNIIDLVKVNYIFIEKAVR